MFVDFDKLMIIKRIGRFIFDIAFVNPAANFFQRDIKVVSHFEFGDLMREDVFLYFGIKFVIEASFASVLQP
jgi:hypothetical protein